MKPTNAPNRVGSAALISLITLVSGLLLTAWGVFQMRQAIEAQAQAQFDRLNTRVEKDILRRFNLPLYGLRGLAGLYRQDDDVSRREVREYVAALDIDNNFPGVRGMGHITRVDRKDFDAFLKAERQDEMPEFVVKTKGDAPDLYVIHRIEPLARNKAALGFDVGQEANRRQGIEQAIATGRATITHRITLVQDAKKRPGLLMYVPMYNRDPAPLSPAERLKALRGVTYSPLVLDEVMNGIMDVSEHKLDITLEERREGLPADSMFEGATPAPTARPSSHPFVKETPIAIGDRAWTLKTSSNHLFNKEVDHSTPTWMATGGVGLSLLLSIVMWLLVSGRQRAENLAAAMTADLRRTARVVKLTSNAAIVMDRDQRITWVNDGFTRLYGYSLEEATGYTMRELVGTDETPRDTLDRLAAACTTGDPCRVEVVNRAKDGQTYWIDTEIQPVYNQANELEGFIELAQDVTELKQLSLRLESALRESEALLQALNMHAIVSVADKQGLITDVNDTFCKISGYERDALIGQNHRIVNSGLHDKAFWTQMWRTIANGHPWRDEIANRAKDGSTYWVDCMIAPIKGGNGKIEKYVSIRTDITAQRQARVALEETTAMLSNVLNSASEVSIIAVDLQGSITLFNTGAERLLGYRADEVIGTHSPVEFHDPMEIKLRSLALAEQMGRPIEGLAVFTDPSTIGRPREWTYIRKDGVRVAVWLVITPQKSTLGETIGYLGVAYDVTQQHAHEASLRQAMRKAEQANLAKSQFLANMSHEIRTPMNAILGMLRLMRRTPLSARQLDYTDKTEGAAQSLLSLLNDILDFSKVEAGKMSLDLQPFSIEALLRNMAVILSASVGTKPLEVLFDVDPSLPDQLIGDALRLQQVLINLGGNAIKFTERGEVVLRLTLLSRTPQIVRLRIAVQDSGIGMAAAAQEKIFDAFTQAEQSTTRQFGGTGLGLAISQRLIELMGGRITVQSELGCGSTFSFDIELPVAPTESMHPAQGAPLRVLIVDDNATARDILQAQAHAVGWTCDVADSGERALALMRDAETNQTPYRAVLLDWQMPGMDGWETSARIRAANGGNHTPLIVMVSAHDRELLAQRSAQEQALLDAYLVKPVTAAMLHEAMQTLLHHDGPVRALLNTTPTTPQTSTRLAQMRILLVEDNLINQQVATELLRDEGATVDVANNGQEGVKVMVMVESDANFDIVLMDVQMPVMDGLTAASRIRELFGDRAPPIIAMTANVQESDRAASLSSGMVDHIGKPFDLDHLVTVLQKHTHRQTSATETAAERPKPAQTVTAELVALAQTHGIGLADAVQRLGGRLDVYQRLLKSFAKDLEGAIDKIDEWWSQGNATALEQWFHSIKGLSATMGHASLSNVMSLAESSVRANMPRHAQPAWLSNVHRAIPSACESLNILLDALTQSMPQQAPANGSAPFNPAKFKQDCAELAALLQQSDMKALDVFETLRQAHGKAMSEQLSELGHAISVLDFDAALLACEQLMSQPLTE